MSFYGQFMAHFTPEQQQTELVKIWAAIGVDTEKTVLEQLAVQNRGMMDINGFYADVYRSWLAFFLRKVPNAFAPRTSVTVINHSSSQTIELKSSYDTSKPSQLSAGGVPFVQPVDVVLGPGDTIHFTAIQGKVVKSTGTYNEIINIATSKVDTSTIKVYLDDEEIPEVSFTSSYTSQRFMGSWDPSLNTASSEEAPGAVHLRDNFGTSHRGEFYQVLRKGTATIPEDNSVSVRVETFYPGEYVMYDGYKWVRNLNVQSLLPNQMDAAYAIPYNGYYAYYQSGSLYIRVFPGDTIPDPEGKSFEVTFIDTDGSQGVAAVDTLGYSSSIQDTKGDKAVVEVSNSATTLGYSSTEAGELACLLRERMFASINVSSIPEYTAWFNAQPEIGDCKVLSDFERKLADESEVDTGFVSVYAVDIEGNPIQAEISSSSGQEENVTNPLVTDLLTRIEPYKDVAALRFMTSPIIENVLRFSYQSASDDTALAAYVNTMANNFYSLDYIRQYGISLFDSLDLNKLLQHIGNAYNSVGLSVEGYHFVAIPVSPSTGLTFTSYEGEKLGFGYYLYYEQEVDSEGNLVTSDGRPVYKAPVRFEERLRVADTSLADIYSPVGVVIGIHDSTGSVSIKNSDSGIRFSNGKVECYWPMSDKGILNIGHVDAVRKLTSSCEDGAIVVERYNGQ